MRPKKSLGQHFLTDPAAARTAVAAGRIDSGTRVLEVGPGRGFLTRYLLEAGASVRAVEMDNGLAHRLAETFRDLDLEVRCGDFLKQDLVQLADPPPAVLVGNLPYNVGLAILRKSLETPTLWTRIVFMFQWEVACRLCASPGGRDYGIPTVMVALTHEASIVRKVLAGAFRPRPRVDSALVLMEPLPHPLLGDAERARFLSFVSKAFRFRRKKASRALAMATGRPSAPYEVMIERCGFAPDSRLERLPLNVLIELWRAEEEATEYRP